MEKIKGGVTAAKGFKAAATAAGIKYTDRTDMAMIYSIVPCQAAGTFTTNIVKAAPVKWDQKAGQRRQSLSMQESQMPVPEKKVWLIAARQPKKRQNC